VPTPPAPITKTFPIILLLLKIFKATKNQLADSNIKH